MGLENRVELIKRLEKIRKSKILCFITSLRPGVPGQIAEDAVRVFFDHLLLLPSRPIKKLDLFLCSNGGSGTVPWRLVSLFREFAKSFNVLIPYRAYSAASLIALGADEIVMHPFAELGPIDPTVSNEFNPVDEATRAKMGISVEDVSAYIHFIKTTVGITHQDELVKALEILATKVHPLALGNVERFLSQSRMIARKILKTHMSTSDDHAIHEIVENMASKLYFHGHPINRKEAREDLGLKVSEQQNATLEATMWDLYKDFEAEFENLVAFNPLGQLMTQAAPQPAPPGTPVVQGQAAPQANFVEYDFLHAAIESARLSSRYTTKHRLTLAAVPAQFLQPGQQAMQDIILQQGWSHSPVQ
jgi:Serine dehydrogenase proteinase